MKRLTILYSRLTGYTAACQRALKESYGVELQVFRWPSAMEAPFGQAVTSHVDEIYDRTEVNTDQMLALVTRFDPSAILVSGWVEAGYLRVCAAMRKRGVPVVAGSDGQWLGTLRQQAARFIAPVYLRRAIDVLWVTGERQRELARRFGYRGARCWDGYYSCDWPRFAVAEPREYPASRPFFLFAGRYVQAKGLDVLVRAYARYRATVTDPWPLVCVGTGDLASTLVGQEGVSDRGFLAPDELRTIMHQAAALVLPSRWEPWGVVVQEAASSGLPLVCSDACGAAVHLLRDGYNGFLFESGKAEDLAIALVRIGRLRRDHWEAMSSRSYELSKQYTPARWAATLVEGIQNLPNA